MIFRFGSFVFILFIFLVSCSDRNNRWIWKDLNGKPRKIVESYHETEIRSGNWEVLDIEDHLIISFDKKGVWLTTEIFDEDNELVYRLVPEYDGRKMTGQAFYDGEGNLESQLVMKNRSKNLIGFTRLDEYEDVIGAGTIFLKNGRPIKEIHEERDGEGTGDVFSVIYEYTNRGDIQGQVYVDEDGDTTLYRKFRYLEYDKRNNWIRRIEYHSPDAGEPEYIVIREIAYK